MTDELKPLLDKLPRVQVGAGLHDLTHDQYHGDPCPEPSLSASIAKILLDRLVTRGFVTIEQPLRRRRLVVKVG